MSLSGKNALITGGSKGMGVATGELFLKIGVTGLVLLDLDEQSLTESTNELRQKYPNAQIIPMKVDVSKKEEIRQAYEETIDKLKHLDIVVNSAGICSFEHLDATIDVNLKGVTNSSLKALEVMGQDKGGKGGIIVNISSIASVQLNEYIPASKFAVTAFTRCLGKELFYGRNKVAVIAVCPGATDTTLLRNLGRPYCNDDIEKAARDFLGRLPVQSPERVAQCIVEAILDGESGSVWFCENNLPARKLNGKNFDTPFN